MSCKFTSILTFITDPTQEVARHFTKMLWQGKCFHCCI